MARKKKTLSSPRSYTNLLYGAMTVVVIFIILFLGIRAISQRQAGLITPEAQQTSEFETYEIKEGDTLWSIAEKEYNDGLKWTEIAKENEIENPNVIEKGTKLTLPAIAKSEVKEGDSSNKVTGGSYKVIEGDNLWDICVRAYGDGYKWAEVAKANNIPNPNLIYPDNNLKLPR